MEMHDEIQQTFSAKLGISPATLSSIFKGRTRPTSNLVETIHRHYPEISVSWLMFGEGDMFTTPNGVDNNGTSDSDKGTAGQSQTNQTETHNDGSLETVEVDNRVQKQSTGVPTRVARQEPATQTIEASGQVMPQLTPQMVELLLAKNQDRRQRQIKEVRIFFDDDTYEVFSPSNKKS